MCDERCRLFVRGYFSGKRVAGYDLWVYFSSCNYFNFIQFYTSFFSREVFHRQLNTTYILVRKISNKFIKVNNFSIPNYYLPPIRVKNSIIIP